MTNVLFCQGVFCVEWILTRSLWTVIFITFTTTDSRIQCRECHCVRLFGAFAFYPPVAQTRFAQTVGLVAEACLHLITPYSWAFPDLFPWSFCLSDSCQNLLNVMAGKMQLRACHTEYFLTGFRDLLSINTWKVRKIRTFHGLFIFQRGLPVPGHRRIRHLWAVLRTTHLRHLRHL